MSWGAGRKGRCVCVCERNGNRRGRVGVRTWPGLADNVGMGCDGQRRPACTQGGKRLFSVYTAHKKRLILVMINLQQCRRTAYRTHCRAAGIERHHWRPAPACATGGPQPHGSVAVHTTSLCCRRVCMCMAGGAASARLQRDPFVPDASTCHRPNAIPHGTWPLVPSMR